MTSARSWIAIGSLAAVAAGLGVFMLWPSGPDPQRIAQGRELFSTHCASCHGADLQGEPNWQTALADGTMPAPPLDGSGHARHHQASELFRIVKEGMAAVNGGQPTAMPAFKDVLTDDEVGAVLAYVESTW